MVTSLTSLPTPSIPTRMAANHYAFLACADKLGKPSGLGRGEKRVHWSFPAQTISKFKVNNSQSQCSYCAVRGTHSSKNLKVLEQGMSTIRPSFPMKKLRHRLGSLGSRMCQGPSLGRRVAWEEGWDSQTLRWNPSVSPSSHWYPPSWQKPWLSFLF